ncbi:MAG: flagellar hook-associated family protein [Roseiarcus sp.]|jgi:flagellar hook-associated protein 3 FlgL
MTTAFVSTSYLGTALLPTIAQTQSSLANLEVESSTGQYANLGLQLGDQSGYELSLKNQNDLLQTLTSGNSIVTTNLTTAQDTLNSILTGAQNAASSLTAWTSGQANSGDTLQNLGVNALQSLIAATNTTSNGQYVFGGLNSSVAPMADYFSSTTSAAKTAIDTAFQTTFGCLPTDAAASSISAGDMQSFLTGPFAAQFSGAAWTTNWSSASSTNTSNQIAPGETIDTSTNANQPGFQQLAEGYAMLSEFGGSQLSSAAQQAVASTATSLITQGLSSITATEAGVGASLQRVTDANNSMSSQMTILQTQIGNLDNVDSATVATTLNTLQTQLQTAYELTAQLQKLSLAQYLPVT